MKNFEMIFEDIYIKGKNYILYDKYWQEPAITELAAHRSISNFDISSSNYIYLAFPWATLIDLSNRKITHNTKKFKDITKAFQFIKNYIANINNDNFLKIITCCQHIHALRYLNFFKECKVTDLFWSHKAKYVNNIQSIKLHPFPLYAVHHDKKNISKFIDDYDLNNFISKKKYLTSFVGAEKHPGYLSNVRERICIDLQNKPSVYIKSRNEWHFQKEVYVKQISENPIENKSLRDLEKEKEYKDVLKNSLFCLCPSGTGSNTIRLWESISLLSIPVILSNSWDHPGDIKIWQDSCLIIDEHSDILKLYETLNTFSKDKKKLKEKLNNLIELRNIYNEDKIANDIVSLLFTKNYDSLSWNNSILSEESQEDNELDPFNELFLDIESKDKVADEIIKKIRYKLNRLNKKYNFENINKIQIILDPKSFNRTPFGYKEYYPYLSKYFKLSSQKNAIDKNKRFVTGMYGQFQRSYLEKINYKGNVALLSEEPLWDILLTRDKGIITSRETFYNFNKKSFLYAGYLSNLFKEIEIPYFLTTSNNYLIRYTYFYQNIINNYSTSKLLNHWNKSKFNFLAFAEKRLESRWEGDIKKEEIIYKTLCNFRSQIIKNFISKKDSKIFGEGWNTSKKRQSLNDWHLNKLSYNGLSKTIIAIENVCAANYITEKPFDALAMLSIPIVYWGSNSDAKDYFIDGSYINLYGKDVDQSISLIRDFKPNIYNAEAYLETLRINLKKFNSLKNLEKSRSKIAKRIYEEINKF